MRSGGVEEGGGGEGMRHSTRAKAKEPLKPPMAFGGQTGTGEDRLCLKYPSLDYDPFPLRDTCSWIGPAWRKSPVGWPLPDRQINVGF